MFNKKMFIRVCFWCIALFLLIFIFRLFYQGFNENNDNAFNRAAISLNSGGQDKSAVRNYATSKMEYTGSQDGTAQVVDQKYEKIANLASSTEKYDEDEAVVYNIIENKKCVIQLENKAGLNGNRKAEMVIGVKPEYFDDTINELSSIGKISLQNTTKSDKTAEYRQMLANKTTLEKTKESYITLRDKGGSITELMTLEQKLIEIEGQIQKQSVDLGDYSDENAFCTINFTLQEKSGSFSLNNIIRFLWNAFAWSVKCYIVILGVVLLTIIFAMILIIFLNQGKKFILNTNDKPDSEK